MRTLTLLAALLLLAIQAQAQTIQETADQVPTQDQPGDEDQDVAVSFTGQERFTREAAGFRRKLCTCRRELFCKIHESYISRCGLFGTKGRLCCL